MSMFETKMFPLDAGKLMDESIEDRGEMVHQLLCSVQDDYECGKLLGYVSDYFRDLVESVGEDGHEVAVDAEKQIRALAKKFKSL